jgi:hypothetical protein
MNVTGKNPGAFAADLGIANEYIVTGLLIRLGFDVGVVQLTRTPFDLWIYAFVNPDGERISLRAQIKTISKNGTIKFGAGVRSGADREYKSDVKAYKYTTEHNDLVIGIDRLSFDMYLVPTFYSEKWGNSKNIGTLEILKNNWNILLNWNPTFLSRLGSQLGLEFEQESLEDYLATIS